MSDITSILTKQLLNQVSNSEQVIDAKGVASFIKEGIQKLADNNLLDSSSARVQMVNKGLNAAEGLLGKSSFKVGVASVLDDKVDTLGTFLNGGDVVPKLPPRAEAESGNNVSADRSANIADEDIIDVELRDKEKPLFRD